MKASDATTAPIPVVLWLRHCLRATCETGNFDVNCEPSRGFRCWLCSVVVIVYLHICILF